MTNELALAISNYVKRPSFIRREVGMSLIRDGHLTRKEEDRLREVLEERTLLRQQKQDGRSLARSFLLRWFR